ncbi:addiction module antidote protein [Neisseriaceae bacterium CLB008]
MNDKLLNFDIADYLDNEEVIAEYINEALASVEQDGDLNVLLAAISDVAKARGMTQVAKDAGLGRESLYKTLAPDAKPRYETVSKLLAAMGLRVGVVPV